MTRVLLLEDNMDVAASLVTAFTDRGITVDVAATVSAAKLHYNRGDLYDVIVLDFELPDGTGLDMLAAIDESDEAITVLYSGLNRTRELKAAGLQVDHQIGKENPFKLIEVVEAVAAR